MINFGTVIIKPSGHIIDEKFINQCKILYLVRDTLTGVFILMTVGSILFAGFSSKDRKTGSILFVLFAIVVLLIIPVPDFVKMVQGDFLVAKYKVIDKSKEYIGAGRGYHVDYYVWFSDEGVPFEYDSPSTGEVETKLVIHRYKLKSEISLYNAAQRGDEVYVVYFGNKVFEIFPVSDYQLD